jgi:hypothetical protein
MNLRKWFITLENKSQIQRLSGIHNPKIGGAGERLRQLKLTDTAKRLCCEPTGINSRRPKTAKERSLKRDLKNNSGQDWRRVIDRQVDVPARPGFDRPTRKGVGQAGGCKSKSTVSWQR